MTLSRPFQRFGQMLLLTLCLGGFFWLSNAEATLPNLPKPLAEKGNKPVLLEFYATWCTACRKMEPLVKSLESETKGKMRVIRLDIDDPLNDTLTKQFNVQGTPTYFIFDGNGKPIFQMRDFISSALLVTVAHKTAGTQRGVPIPKELDSLTANTKPYMFLQFHPEKCDPCTQLKGYSNYLSEKFGTDVAVVELNLEDPVVKRYKRQFKMTNSPGYVLVDRDGYEYFQVDGSLGREEKYMLWQYLNLVLKSRP